MSPNPLRTKYKLIGAIAFVVIAGVVIYIYRVPIWEKIEYYYAFFSNREQVKAFISSFGALAPVIFICIQMFQVLFAPIPGEATGFIGGYLFGTWPGFLYSSIALTVGSWLNFCIGRFFGKRYIRRLVPPRHLEKFDQLLNRQGILVIFLLFVFPGFPKDYFCFFLGLSHLPLRAFLVLSAIGRMPGTLMLSMQGAFLFERKFGLSALMLSACLAVVYIAYRYREKLYALIESVNHKSSNSD